MLGNQPLLSFISVGVGAMFGAWLRWVMGLLMNAVLPNLPLGTLVVNLTGGFLVGLALGLIEVGAFEHHHLRLLLVTGFLGGLTTFSTFSGESLILLQKHAYVWALGHTLSHVLGALLMAGLGFALIQYFK